MTDETNPGGTPDNIPNQANAGEDIATDTALQGPLSGGAEVAIPEFDADPAAKDEDASDTVERSIEALLNVDLDVSVVLGHSKMPISTLLKLSRGSVIELEQRIGEPVRIVVNNKVVARGELIKLNGDRLGVSLTEIVREHMGTD